MIRLYLVLTLFLILNSNALAQNTRWIRACLDDDNNILNLEFVVASDCDDVVTKIYGEKVFGSGFNLIGSVDSNGIKNVSLSAQSSSNWRLYLTLVNPCNNDSVTGNIVLVDNTPPQNVGIDSVSVTDDGVLIGWKASASADVKNYILYYDKGNGFSETLDTVSSETLSYLENSDSLDANSKSETYRIAAIDSCDIGTGQVDAHSTMFLSLNNVDYCDRNLSVTRTNYIGWDGDIEYNLVFREVGKSKWDVLSLFEYNDLYLELNDYKIDFEIKVRAKNIVSGYTSSSNTLLVQFGDERSLDTFYITKVDFRNDSTLLEWYTTKTTLVNNYELQFSEKNGVKWNTIRSIKAKGGGEHSLWLKNNIAGRLYRLRAISDCGDDLGYSNIARVIDLNIISPGGDSFNKSLQDARELRWNSFINWNNGVDRYEIERLLNGSWSIVGSTSDTFFIDLESVEEIAVDSGICYRIKAVEKEPFIDFKSGEALTSTKCIFFNFHGALPNGMVFSNTEDKQFEILVENLDTANSYLTIYNRWGEIVFNDGLKWNGGLNNEKSKPCPDGVYFYIARIQLKNRDFYFVSSSLKVLW
jgi:hypothetical protein